MLVLLSPISVAGTKIIYGYNFVAPLNFPLYLCATDGIAFTDTVKQI